MASPVLTTIEAVCEGGCWETYSGCCSPRSHAATPGEGERKSQRAMSWMNKPTDVVIDFTAAQRCHYAEFRSSHLHRANAFTSFLKLAGRISAPPGGKSTTTRSTNSLSTGSDLLLLCLQSLFPLTSPPMCRCAYQNRTHKSIEKHLLLQSENSCRSRDRLWHLCWF